MSLAQDATAEQPGWNTGAVYWLEERGVPYAELAAFKKRSRLETLTCRPTAIGPHCGLALDCFSSQRIKVNTTERDPEYRHVAERVIVEVDSGRLKLVFRVTEGVVSDDGRDPVGTPIVRVPITMSDDGRKVTVGGEFGADADNWLCDKVLAPLRRKARAPDATTLNALDYRLARAACVDRGTYEWRDDRFVRSPPTPR